MVFLGFKPTAAGWKGKTNPLGNGRLANISAVQRFESQLSKVMTKKLFKVSKIYFLPKMSRTKVTKSTYIK